MKIIIRGVIDWRTLQIEECDSFEYEGPLMLAKDNGSPPQAVDPYTQAAAQYGLSTGTALFNAGLNRTNQVNPLGSTSWSAGYGGASQPPPGGQSLPTTNYGPNSGFNGPIGGSGLPIGGTAPSASSPGVPIANSPYRSLNPALQPFGGSPTGFGFGGNTPTPGSLPSGGQNPYGGAPQYTQVTQLAPQFQSQLEQPIDTSGLAGMPGGPSTTQDLQNTQDALYKSQEQYLQPEQALESEQLKSQLANEGLTPGSAGYNNEMDRLSRQQEFQNSSARTSAITGAGAEQSRLFGLGTQGLQNQLAVRNAPISEWAALNGSGGASAQALTPDISGAFGQQLQSQLAGYNANVASNNATTQDATSLAALAAMYFMM